MNRRIGAIEPGLFLLATLLSATPAAWSGIQNCDDRLAAARGDLEQGETAGLRERTAGCLEQAPLGLPAPPVSRLLKQARILLALGEAGQGRTMAAAALNAAWRMEDDLLEAQAHTTLGNAFFDLDDLPRAWDHFQAALDIYRRRGEAHAEAQALKNAGITALALSHCST